MRAIKVLGGAFSIFGGECVEIVKKPIESLIPADYNPRKDLTPSDPEYQRLKRSVEEFGYVEPVIYNKRTGVVVGGHQRLKVLKELGFKEIDCVEIDIDEVKEKALNVALNKISGSWDDIKLKELLTELTDLDYDVELTGFTVSELESLEVIEPPKPKDVVEDDYDPLQEVPKRVSDGDLWRLGEHLLYCGDSTQEGSYIKLLGSEKADLVFTDPPYGMKKEKDGVENDNLNFDDLLEFNKQWIPLTFKFTKENGSWYCWGIDEPLMDIYSEILKPMQKENKITFRNLLTWEKKNDNPTMLFNGACSSTNRSYYTNEKCLFVMCGVQGFNNNSDNYFEGWEPIRSYLENEAKKVGLDSKKLKEICGVGMWGHWFTKSQFTFIPEEHYKKLQKYYSQNDAFKREYDALKREWYSTRAYFDGTKSKCTDVWEFDVTNSEERKLAGGHATPKPLKLCQKGIETSSQSGEIVLDVFGGSGSTLIACEQLGRKCRMMELTPHYCDVIINRWETITGKKAEKLR